MGTEDALARLRPIVSSPEMPDRVIEYFSEHAEAGDRFTGRWFERFAGGGDRPDVANVFTSDDLVALSLLDVPVEGPAALELLGFDRLSTRDWSNLLAAVPNDLDATQPEGQEFLRDDGSAAVVLWKTLLEVPRFGTTRAGKLLARKRPHLIPVHDSVIAREIGAGDRWWATVADFMAESENVATLRSVHASLPVARRTEVSLLRVLDVAIWMHGRSAQPGPENLGMPD